MSKVYITDYIQNHDVERSILGKDLSHHGLHPNIKVLLVWHESITKKYIDNLTKLKGIVRYGVGFDNVDIEHAKAKNIFVCNTPDYGIDEVSDTTIGMIMNIVRGITRYDFQCRAYYDDWQENTIKTIRRTSEYVLGVIGAGRIGGSVIIKAKFLGFQTVFYDPYKERGYEKLLGAKRVESLDELLSLADIVSVHTPLTDETRSMVTREFVYKMKSGSSFINTARGNIISDICIFYEVLKNNHFTNVALDVLPDEPPKDCELIKAWRNREDWLEGRLIINSHCAYYSTDAFLEMRQKAALNALRILRNERPLNIVNEI